MSWSKDYKKSIDCDNPRGFSQRSHCAARRKRKRGEETRSKSLFSEGTLHHWYQGSESEGGKPGWVQSDGSPCANEPGETKTPKCFSSGRLRALKRKGKKGLSLIKSAVRRKRQKDKGQQEKSGAAAPTNVPTFAKGKKDKNYVKSEPGIKESMELNEAKKDRPGKGSGTKDACYHKVKSRYDVWPSAYASGALVKCRKVGAANWGTKTEEATTSLNYDWDTPIRERPDRYCPKCEKLELRHECKYGPKYWDLYSLPAEIIQNKKDYSVTMPYAVPNSVSVSPSLSLNQMRYNSTRPHPANEEKDHEYSMARSELSTIISAAKRLKKKMKGEGGIEAWVQSKITKAADYIDTAADYLESGEHKIESVSIEDSNGRHYAEFIDIIKVEPLKPSRGIGSRLLGEGSKKCWKGYEKKGSQEIFGKRYNRCVKSEEYSDWRKELFEQGNYIMPSASQSGAYSGGIKGRAYKVGDTIPTSATKPKPQLNLKAIRDAGDKYGKTTFNEDWQSANRKDRTDGMSRKTVKKYRDENPGSKLQTAVTEKKPTGKRAKRRANFCRRMKGMKSKLTSAKTARDPDSRINKALRRWNCN
jgi:hypothetical protein